MKKFLVIIVVILAAVIVFFAAKATVDDADGLAGEAWTLVGIEADGKKIPKEKVAIKKIRFTKDRVTWYIDGEDGIDGAFRLDPSKQPKQIDLAMPADGPEERDQIEHGIYDVKEDTLFLCTGVERPTEFKTGPRSQRVLWVFRR